MNRALALIIVILALGGVAYTTACPCERIPGAWLLGTTDSEPVSDWSFVNDRDAVPLCQLQITTWRPHSINLNCMSDGGALYVSCSNCAGKRWSNDALTHPHARLRAGSTIYPVTLKRLTEPAQLDLAWQARARKTNRESSDRPDHWWSFQLTSASH